MGVVLCFWVQTINLTVQSGHTSAAQANTLQCHKDQLTSLAGGLQVISHLQGSFNDQFQHLTLHTEPASSASPLGTYAQQYLDCLHQNAMLCYTILKEQFLLS